MLTVKCDAPGCGWSHVYPVSSASEATPVIQSWMGKPCPSCRQGEMVTAAEAAFHRAMVVLEMVSRFLSALFPFLKMGTVRVSTSPMREGKPATFQKVEKT